MNNYVAEILGGHGPPRPPHRTATAYVGMARKQNGGYNASISVQTPLVHLVANCTHQKTVKSAL